MGLNSAGTCRSSATCGVRTSLWNQSVCVPADRVFEGIDNPSARALQADGVVYTLFRKPAFPIVQEFLAQNGVEGRSASETGSCRVLYSVSIAPGVKRAKTGREASNAA